MSDRLRVLDELGRELDGALARESAVTARRPVRRTLVIALATALLLAGAAFAASYALTGNAIPGARGADVPPEATPRPGTAQLVDLRAKDPAGDAPPWTLRLSTSQTGQLCAAVGQEVEDEFGLVGLDGRFRRLPLLGLDACAAREGPSPALIGSRIFDAERPDDVRTVVYGVAGTGLREATVTVGGERRELELGAGGSFIATYRGYVEDVRPEVALRFEDDKARSFAFGRLEEASAPDPEGGAPWVVDATPRTGGDRDGQTCAQVRQARGRDGGGLFGGTPPVCGDLAAAGVFFEVASFPRASDLFDEPGPFLWSPTLARTVLWGAADESVEAIDVVRGDQRAAVDLSAEGPGFVAVLPAGTEPEALVIGVRRRDGTVTTHRGGINLLTAEGEPRQSDARDPVLAAAPPLPGAPGSGEEGEIPERFEHDEDSVRIEARGEAVSGPDWALRTWRARERDGGTRVVCAQVGRVDEGSFGLPEPGGALRPLELSEEDAAACAARDGELQPERVETFLDDPLAYAPEPIATVAWGLAGEDAERVDVRGPWGERSAEPTERGGYLVVLDPTLLDTEAARIYVRTRDGETLTSRNPGFTPTRVVPGSVQIDARTPDPDGLQPWAVQLWRTEGAGGVCREEGRLVAGRIGAVGHERGTFAPFPMHEASDCTDPRAGAWPGGSPVTFKVGSTFGGPLEESDALARARVRRRTLPGRTTISGVAADGVRTVTVRSPRDVRTLRPAPGGTFLIVYDGTFVGSAEVEATATLEDGRTVTSALPLMP